MVVVDASIIGPVVLLDETPLPAQIGAALVAGPLVAPAHWPMELTNLLLMANRRGRLDAAGWRDAYDVVAALRVGVERAPAIDAWHAVAALAEQERLTAYDAGYLHLALVRSLPIATLDRALAEAARRRGVHVLTYR